MGWSCSAIAGDRLNAIHAACVKQTGSSNVYEHAGIRYFFNASRREHQDGAITGTVNRFIGENECTRAGTFRIERTGRVSRGPRFLKTASPMILVVDRLERIWKGVDNPTDTDLRTYVKTEYVKQFLPGGRNVHLSNHLGFVPYPREAMILNSQTGKTVATWQAATFEAWA